MSQIYRVYFVDEAEKDLFEIYSYVANNDSEAAAEKLIDKLEQHCLKLATLPDRVHHPRELKRFGIASYREISLKPHRIIYQIIGDEVYIHAILDTRRDLADHLIRRLI